MLAKLMTNDLPVPPGARLLGWIDRHPSPGHTGCGYAVLAMRTGVEVAWDGQCIRSLPRNWRELVKFEEVAAVDA